MCGIDEEFQKHVVIEGNKRALRLALNKASCVCVQSALFWCRMMSSYLIDLEFVLNPHDPYVANKDIPAMPVLQTRCCMTQINQSDFS